jgi:hypothetical protein
MSIYEKQDLAVRELKAARTGTNTSSTSLVTTVATEGGCNVGSVVSASLPQGEEGLSLVPFHSSSSEQLHDGEEGQGIFDISPDKQQQQQLQHSQYSLHQPYLQEASQESVVAIDSVTDMDEALFAISPDHKAATAAAQHEQVQGAWPDPAAEAKIKIFRVSACDGGDSEHSSQLGDSGSEASSQLGTARAGEGDRQHKQHNQHHEHDSDGDREGGHPMMMMTRNSSFAFHGKSRDGERRVTWEDDGRRANDNDDNESVVTTVTTGTAGTAGSLVRAGDANKDQPVHVQTATEVRASNPVVLPGRGPMVPATSRLIEHRKILALPLALPAGASNQNSYTATVLSEEHRVQLLLPLNRKSKEAVKKREFETARKQALLQLQEDVGRKQQSMYGGLLAHHIQGKPLNSFEEVIVTENHEFRRFRRDEFKELNPYYKQNQHEVTSRLLLGCVDKPRLRNMDSYLHGYLGRENLLVHALKKRYRIWEYVAPAMPSIAAALAEGSDQIDGSGRDCGEEGNVSLASESVAASSVSNGDAGMPADDLAYDVPDNVLAAPNLLSRSFAILISAEEVLPPDALEAISNAASNSAVGPWKDGIRDADRAHDKVGMKKVREVLERADRAAELLIATSEKVSRVHRDAARKRILQRKKREAALRKAKDGPPPAQEEDQTALVPAIAARTISESAEDERKKEDREGQQLFVPISLFVMENGILEVFVSAVQTGRFDPDLCSTGLPLVAKALSAASFSHDRMLLTRFMAINGVEALIECLRHNNKRCDIFLWTCRALLFLQQSPFNHSCGATARMITSDVCAVFASCWQLLSDPFHCVAGSDEFGEEFIPERDIDCPSVASAMCFFTGMELLALTCSNTSENSRMNSTKMAINKKSPESDAQELLREQMRKTRTKGSNKGGKDEADVLGIRNVKTVGEKAIQLLEFPVTSFLGSIDMARVRSMMLVLDELQEQDASPKSSRLRAAAKEGPIVVAHATLLQSSLHATNHEGVTSNEGIPVPRRVQGIPLATMAQNQSSMEKVLELFDIDMPSNA